MNPDLASRIHNLHTHSYRCKHATGDVEDYARLLLERGGRTFGMADHTPLPDGRWADVRMGMEELEDYCAKTRGAKAKFPELEIHLGMECDYAPEYFSFYREELLGRHGLDYLIGAGHYFPLDGDWHNSFTQIKEARALRAYVTALCEMMESGLFLFIAHPDLFGCGYLHWNPELEAATEDLLDAAEETGAALELNAAGYGKHWRGHGELRPHPYPWEPFWERVAARGISTVISLDAHSPKDYFQGLERAWALSLRLGLKLVDPVGLMKGSKPKS